jgi:polysaccharide pyruvyl transferase WcaK-like protein
VIGAFQICNGLGSGNIGDDLMAWAFWDHIPDDLLLDVPLLPEAALRQQSYTSRHRYIPVDWQGNECAATRLPGLLVGATPVSDREGVHWPLAFLAPRLRHFHQHGLPVDVVGAGVEGCGSAEGRALFDDAFAPVRSWTVRTAFCRDTLLALGVAPERVHVAADLAWLYTARRDLRSWAAALWRDIGIDPNGPLLVINVVNMIWGDRREAKRSIAEALDRASQRDLQIAFFCNECRDGEFFDFAAAREMAALLKRPAALVPNRYYSPDEALALLGYANVAVGQRYHFIAETVMAGSVPVAISRGPKIDGLAAELGLDVSGTVETVDADRLDAAIVDAVEQRDSWLRRLDQARRQLRARAATNLRFIRQLPPYAACQGSWGAAAADPVS